MRNFVVTIDGKKYSVGVEEVESTDGNVTPVVSTVAAAPKAAPAPATKAPAASNANGEKVLSPFPGLIKKLLVAEGDTVKKDQPVMVLEAMKMDNDITSPCAGKISFAVQQGANVETNAVLAVIG